MSIFEAQLAKDRANYEPLTPVSFLRRAAQVAPSHTAIIHGQRRYTYAQFLARSSQLANALAGRGIGPGDCVAIMGANTPEMLEAHNGVPMHFAPNQQVKKRAVLQCINQETPRGCR